MSLQRVSKRIKSTKMKQQTAAKKKKVAMSKALEDSISETISFVIKGKLTPIKSTFVNKKTKITKKDLSKKLIKKLPKKTEKNDKSILEVNNEVNKDDKGVITLKEQKPKKVKRDDNEMKYEEGEVRTKTSKKQCTIQKHIKKESSITQIDEPKKEDKTTINNSKKDSTIQRSKERRYKNKTPQQEQQQKPQKKYQPKSKKVINKPIKVCVKSKRNNVNKRNTLTSKRKTIENLMKQVNKDLKEPITKCDEVKSCTTTKEEKDLKSKNTIESNKEVKKGKIKTMSTTTTTQNAKIKNEILKCKPRKKITIVKERKKNNNSTKKIARKKIKTEDANLSTDDTSDEITLDLLRQQTIKTETEKQTGIDDAFKTNKKVKVEQESDVENKRKSKENTTTKPKKKNVTKSKLVLMKKRVVTASKDKNKPKPDRSRKMKLFGFWNGPKRHRVASLNALAKVHCLYENESRGNILDNIPPSRNKEDDKKASTKSEDDKTEIPSMRTLRSQPGLRAIGKHWDMHDSTSSSSEELTDIESDHETADVKSEGNDEKPKERKKPVKRKRNRNELIMDLKDMVVRKRMASLNASAILAASYCVEKRSLKSPTIDETTTDTDDSDDTYVEETERKKPTTIDDDIKKEDDRKVFEVCATPNKKVAVILNQDTDVTITGVYVNSTTRSTHHEGYCSIAGMQYRISATSHTQTAATAVATETILQSASSSSQENVSFISIKLISR